MESSEAQSIENNNQITKSEQKVQEKPKSKSSKDKRSSVNHGKTTNPLEAGKVKSSKGPTATSSSSKPPVTKRGESSQKKDSIGSATGHRRGSKKHHATDDS